MGGWVAPTRRSGVWGGLPYGSSSGGGGCAFSVHEHQLQFPLRQQPLRPPYPLPIPRRPRAGGVASLRRSSFPPPTPLQVERLLLASVNETLFKQGYASVLDLQLMRVDFNSNYEDTITNIQLQEQLKVDARRPQQPCPTPPTRKEQQRGDQPRHPLVAGGGHIALMQSEASITTPFHMRGGVVGERDSPAHTAHTPPPH